MVPDVFTNVFLANVFFVIEDRNGIVVLLVVEEDIKSTLLEVVQLELEWHLAEQRAFFVVERIDVQNLDV